MIYILDAYNVIHKVRKFERALDQNLRAAREALIAACGRLAVCRGDIAQMILVFDGRSEYADLPHVCPPKVRLVFSDTGQDADERIISVLEELPEKIQKRVVSDDNFVRNQARSHQTRIMTVAEFETFLSLAGPREIKTRPEKTSALPQKIANEITAAYKKELGL